MSTNIKFEFISQPFRSQYSAANHLMCIQRVRWKGDWCMTITKEYVPSYENAPPFLVYTHWPELGFVCYQEQTLEAAQARATEHMERIEKFLRAKFFMPKLKGGCDAV